jgi:hypothetical protein
MFFISLRVFANFAVGGNSNVGRNKWAMQETRLPLQLTRITNPGYNAQSLRLGF